MTPAYKPATWTLSHAAVVTLCSLLDPLASPPRDAEGMQLTFRVNFSESDRGLLFVLTGGNPLRGHDSCTTLLFYLCLFSPPGGVQPPKSRAPTGTQEPGPSPTNTEPALCRILHYQRIKRTRH